MIDRHFGYAAEKFTAARSALMLPHPRGEAQSIAGAFHECRIGLHHLNSDKLDETAREWIQTLEHLMDTHGIDDPSGRGTWLIKAEQFTEQEKFEISRVIDELAHWFARAEGS